jgi:hypothetical protein
VKYWKLTTETSEIVNTKMKRGKHMRTITNIIFAAFAMFAFSFVLSPSSQAVLPPPPGGYPNFTTAAGDHALQALTLGVGNTAIGTFSLFRVTTGNFNTAVGAGSLDLNTGDYNTATGAAALLFNVFGSGNTAVGTAALEFNNDGINNTANGAFALFSNLGGNGNTAVGFNALHDDIIGVGNTAIGHQALESALGGFNIALGTNAGSAVVSAHDVICIGHAGADVNSTTWISNVYGVTTQSGTTAPVVISDTGQLGTVASSERFKKDVATMDEASEAILSLRPVTFHYKTDTKDTPQFGLIAEEVAKVNPALVLPDKDGKPYTVRYDAVNAMLLNEFLKERNAFVGEQRKVEKLEAAVTNLMATVKEQAAQIQKVSAQLELSKAAPQTVLNSR